MSERSMPAEPVDLWVRCNSCKKPILYRQKYWVCTVSTCNRLRTGLKFCTVSCWDAHSPMMNHRESWAEERTAPTREEWAKTLAGESEPKRRRSVKSRELPAEAKVESGTPKVILRRK